MLLPTENIGEGSFSQSRDPPAEDKCKKTPCGAFRPQAKTTVACLIYTNENKE